jgi:GT2 family glycosyltransferase
MSQANSPALDNRAVLILGMHRSGTSALARVLNLMGADLGADLLPPAADNQTGFWEHQQISHIHDRIYESLGCDWTKVSAFPDRWWERPEIEEYRRELRQVIARDFSGVPLWCVKDPRLCAMLPIWRPLLGEMNCRPVCVLIFRNPAEVGESLAKRDGLAASRTYLLWLRSTVYAERGSRGLPRAIVTYDGLLSDWEAQVRRIGEELGIQWPVAPEAAAPQVAQFIDGAFRHHRVDNERFLADSAVPELVRRMYAAVLQAAASGRADDLSETVDRIAGELDEACPLVASFVKDFESENRSMVVSRNLEAIDLHGRIAKLAEGLSAATAELGAAKKEIARDKSALGGIQSELDDIRRRASAWLGQSPVGLQANAQIEASPAEVAKRASAVGRDLDQLGNALDEKNKALGEKNKALGERAESILRLEQERGALRGEIALSYRTRDLLGSSLRTFFRSRLWKIAAPIRTAARALGKWRLGIDRLAPLAGARREADGSWAGSGAPPHFLLPIHPTRGWVRVKAKIWTSVSSRAVLYFDTGSSFHQLEHVELGPVNGETTIDRVFPLGDTAYLLRFDPIQHPGEFVVREFSFSPVSRLRVNVSAVFGNVRKAIFRRGESRGPSLKIGLLLLLKGQWRTFHRQLLANAIGSVNAGDYEQWLKRHQITDRARAQMRKTIETWQNPPSISLIVPVYNIAELYLRACIDSVRRQIYPHWELCIADDRSTEPHIKRVLDEYAAMDSRIKVVYRGKNGNISAASNTALELATGQYIALLDHDDELSEHALFRMAEAIVGDPSLDMIYSDEDKLTPGGKRHDPFFKPDWSPEYFLACMYTGHLGVYRADMVRRIGGWRSQFDGAQDYDLVLRIVASKPRIHHIPDILYHWRTIPTSTASGAKAKPEAHQRAQMVLQSYLDLIGREGSVEPGPSEGFHRIRYKIVGNPKVSIVIPTAGRPADIRGVQSWFLLECVSSIRRLSTYGNIEIIAVDNNDLSPELAAAIEPFDVRLIRYIEPFNLARKMNQGAFAAEGEHLILLNDDIEVVSPEWIESMLEYSQWPEIGAVGAQLLFPNNTRQHSGVYLLEGNPGHPFYQFAADHPGYYLSSKVHRNWSAVTGACMMTRAEVFKSVGGFNESFPLNYNDVDYCLKVLDSGKRVVYTPYATLYHHESVSKTGTYAHELETFKSVWKKRFPRDPYYNPNLTVQSCDFRIA